MSLHLHAYVSPRHLSFLQSGSSSVHRSTERRRKMGCKNQVVPCKCATWCLLEYVRMHVHMYITYIPSMYIHIFIYIHRWDVWIYTVYISYQPAIGWKNKLLLNIKNDFKRRKTSTWPLEFGVPKWMGPRVPFSAPPNLVRKHHYHNLPGLAWPSSDSNPRRNSRR